MNRMDRMMGAKFHVSSFGFGVRVAGGTVRDGASVGEGWWQDRRVGGGCTVVNAR